MYDKLYVVGLVSVSWVSYLNVFS